MATFKIGVCEPEGFSENAIKLLSCYGEVYLMGNEGLKEFIKDKDAIFVRLKHKIDDDLINGAERLRFVCSPTTGLNHISISNQNVRIISLKGEYGFLKEIRATPEHVFGLTLALLRNYNSCFLNDHNHTWNRDLYKGYELYQNKVGIIGIGRIGTIISRYFRSFDSEVFYFDIDDSKSLPFCYKCKSLEDLVEKSNIIVLEANYTVENEKMIDRSLLLKMRHKYFVNAARGELVDETALMELIQKDWFKGVAIDVVSNETNNEVVIDELITLTENHNLIVTPHIGGATYSSMRRTEDFISQKLIDCAFGEE